MSHNKLKVIALITMIIDHIHIIFPFSTPLWIRWIGRLSAPLFIFCLVAIYFTSVFRKRYCGNCEYDQRMV